MWFLLKTLFCSEDDLYRGEDEIEQERIAKASSEEHTFPGSQPLCECNRVMPLLSDYDTIQ